MKRGVLLTQIERNNVILQHKSRQFIYGANKPRTN